MAIRQENIIVEFDIRVQEAIRLLNIARKSVVGLESSLDGASAKARTAFSLRQIDDAIKDMRVLDKEINDARKGLDRFNDEANETGRGLGNILEIATGFSLASLFEEGVRALVDFGGQLSDRARELEGIDSRFAEVFDDSAEQVEDFGRQVALSMGLSQAQFRNAAAGAGDLLIPLGFLPQQAADLSQELLALSGPLSQWVGGTYDAVEVSEILTKSLLGEREQLKQLGVAINEAEVQQQIANDTTGKYNGLLDSQAKALATIDILYQKTEDAQAAFALQTNKTAIATARAQAEFNELIDQLARDFQPFVQDLTISFGSLLRSVNGLINPTREAVRSYDELAQTLKTADNTVLPLVAELEDLQKQTELTSDQQSRLREIAAGLAAAYPEAGAGVDQFTGEVRLSTQAVRDAIRFQRDLNDTQKEYAEERLVRSIENLKKNRAEQQANLETVRKLLREYQDQNDTLGRVEGLQETLNTLLRRASRTNDELIEKERELARIRGESATALENIATSQTDATVADENRLNTIQALEREIKRLKEQNEKLDFTTQADQIRANVRTIQEYEAQIKSLTGSQSKANKSGKDFADTLKELQEATQDLTVENLADPLDQELQGLILQIERRRADFRGLLSDTVAGPEERAQLQAALDLLEQQLNIFLENRKRQIEAANLNLPSLLPTTLEIKKQADDLEKALVEAAGKALTELDKVLGIDTSVFIDAEVTTNLKPPNPADTRRTFQDVALVAVEQLEGIFSNIEVAATALAASVGPALQSISDITQRQIDLLDIAIDRQNERVQNAIEIAEFGNAELLQIEEERLDRIEAQRQQQLKKEQQLAAAQIAINQAVAISSAIRGLLQAFTTPGGVGIVLGIASAIAIATAIAGLIASVRSAFSSIPSFDVGTKELTAGKVDANRSSKPSQAHKKSTKRERSGRQFGRKLIWAHLGERILSRQENNTIGAGKVSNTELVKQVMAFREIKNIVGGSTPSAVNNRIRSLVADGPDTRIAGPVLFPIALPIPSAIEAGNNPMLAQLNEAIGAMVKEQHKLSETVQDVVKKINAQNVHFNIDEKGISSIVTRQMEARRKIDDILR